MGGSGKSYASEGLSFEGHQIEISIASILLWPDRSALPSLELESRIPVCVSSPEAFVISVQILTAGYPRPDSTRTFTITGTLLSLVHHKQLVFPPYAP